MNKTSIRRVATAILNRELADRDIGFNMCPWKSAAGNGMFDATNDKSGRGCGTVACIAGWTVFLFHPKSKSTSGAYISRKAAKILGLDAETAEALFTAGENFFRRMEVTPERAALVLFNLAETGNVDWNILASKTTINLAA